MPGFALFVMTGYTFPMSRHTAIVWFRQDLRLSDNPALTAAVKSGAHILPVYILDDANAEEWRMGGASRAWLHRSLEQLDQSLHGNLVLLEGDALIQIPALAQESGVNAVYWNRCYEPWRVRRDRLVKETLSGMRIEGHSFNGSLLWEPWDVLKQDGTPYKVFTPFYRRGCLSKEAPRMPLPSPKDIPFATHRGLRTEALNLLPQKPEPRWDNAMMAEWHAGEDGARTRLEHFIAHGLADYKNGRNYMAQDNVSRLSPHLHFGEISSRQAWHAARAYGDTADVDMFCSELGWREFSHHLLYHFPHITRAPIQQRFNAFPWEKDTGLLEAWQRGQTGYPVVDAAMRELWQTGYMHNRARMIVGSFLVKHLLLHWHHGEDWFWDCLVDADLANNSASWQWIAGCGADAAPYFRIFNPVTQGETFDASGEYVRKYVPEIAALPDKYLHRPWDAPPHVLAHAGVTPGKTYPHPVVDHAAARERALEAFKATKDEEE